MASSCKIDFCSPAVFSYAFLHANQTVLRSLSVTNAFDEPIENAVLTISSEPSFFAPFVQSLGVLLPKSKRMFTNLSLAYDTTFLAYLSETLTAKISVSIRSEDGTEIAVSARNCDLLPHDAWGGVHFMPELLSCLVTPEQPQVQDLARQARALLAKKHLSLPLEGYQASTSRTLMRGVSEAVIGAVFQSIHSSRIIFSIQPPELSKRGAKILLPEETLAKKAGNTLDVAILFASCVESLGLHPVIVLLGGAILCGAYLENVYSAFPVINTKSQFLQLCADNSLCLLETTAMANGTSVSFSGARLRAQNALRDTSEFLMALDLRACRECGLIPLDNRVFYEDGLHFEKPGLSEDEDDIFRNDTAIEEASPVPLVGNLRAMRRFLLEQSPDNSLLCVGESTSVPLTVRSVKEFTRLLDSGETIPFLPEPGDPPAPFCLSGELQQSVLSLEKMDSTAAQSGLELFLYFGEISYPVGEETLRAPLLLLPVTLVRRRSHVFGFVSDGGAPKPNTALFSLLAQTHSLDFSGVRAVSASEPEIYLAEAFAAAASALPAAGNVKLQKKNCGLVFACALTNPLLNALTLSRMEEHSLAGALCAGEVSQNLSLPVEESKVPDELDPILLPIPYQLNRDSMDALQQANTNDDLLVFAPPCGGKTRLAAALCFAQLHSQRTVLYITGQNGNPTDALRDFARAGISDLVLPLSHGSPADASLEMSQTNPFPTEEYFTQNAAYLELRRDCAAYEKILYKKQSCGIDLEEAILRYDRVRTAPDCIHFLPEQIGSLSQESAEDRFEVIRALAAALGTVGSPVKHPLRYVRAREFSYEIKGEAVRLLEEYAQKTKRYLTFLRGSCAGMFPKTKLNNELQEQAFLDVLLLLGEGHCICPCYFEEEQTAETLSMAQTVLSYGKECLKLRDTVVSQFTKEAFSLPVKEMIVSWRDAEVQKSGLRKKEQKAIAQKLSACCNVPVKPDNTVLDKLYQLEKYCNYKSYLEENAPLIRKLFGIDITAPENDTNELWNSLSELFVLCDKLSHTLQRLSEKSSAPRADIVRYMKDCTEEDAARCLSLRDAILEMKEDLSKTEARIVAYLSLDLPTFRASNEETLYEELPKLQQQLLRGMDSFRDWTAYLRACDEGVRCGFERILELIDAEKLTGETLEDAYERAFFSSLCESVFLRNPELARLRGDSFENQLNALMEKREELYALSKQDLLSKQLRRYLSFLEESGVDRTKTYSVTPRVFSEECYVLTQRYPVLIADAREAIRYLDAAPSRFDLLILDDAQTLSMPEALALIPRAAKLCVFATDSLSESENVYLTEGPMRRSHEELPRFLETARTVLPNLSLSFSYFKNAHLYDLCCTVSGRTYTTIPFAKASEPFRCLKTPGKFDPVGGTNVQEAVQAVEEILRYLERSQESLSLGVFAATRAQKNLILRTLARRLKERTELYGALQNAAESFYVASPEDGAIARRDTLLVSLTIAPDEEGKLARAFPLFARPDGADLLARLCGACRECLCVLHSIHFDSLELLSVPTKAGKTFEVMTRTLLSAPSDLRAVNEDTSVAMHPIAVRIAEVLEQKGYRCAFSLSCGAFTIDLAVRSAKEEQGYVLAVLLDAGLYSRMSSDLISQARLVQELETRGFQTVRVRDTDWFENDNAQIERILKLLSREDYRGSKKN